MNWRFLQYSNITVEHHSCFSLGPLLLVNFRRHLFFLITDQAMQAVLRVVQPFQKGHLKSLASQLFLKVLSAQVEQAQCTCLRRQKKRISTRRAEKSSSRQILRAQTPSCLRSRRLQTWLSVPQRRHLSAAPRPASCTALPCLVQTWERYGQGKPNDDNNNDNNNNNTNINNNNDNNNNSINNNINLKIIFWEECFHH